MFRGWRKREATIVRVRETAKGRRRGAVLAYEVPRDGWRRNLARRSRIRDGTSARSEVELGHEPVVRCAGCTATPRGAGGLIRIFVFIRLHGVSKTGSAVSRLSLEVTSGKNSRNYRQVSQRKSNLLAPDFAANRFPTGLARLPSRGGHRNPGFEEIRRFQGCQSSNLNRIR